jgi:hypothetical protein
MILLFQWGNPDPINLIIFIVYAVMAILMWKTFKEGQRQSNISLSISQFNILNKEFEGLLSEAQNMKFKSELEDLQLKPFRHSFEKSNGIYYISLFTILDTIKYYKDPSDEKENYIIDFRHNVIFPLSRFYDKIHHFLQRVQIDKTINDDHKRILYYYIERDLLQTYFRVCNHRFGNILQCSLADIETEVFKEAAFHEINVFYKRNSLFQFKNLNFYETTF